MSTEFQNEATMRRRFEPLVIPMLRSNLIACVILATIVAGAGNVQARPPAADGHAVLAVVRDGPANSIRYDEYLDLVNERLRDLAGDDYRIVLLEEFEADFTLDGVRRELLRALSDPRTEVVLAAGPIVTELAARLPSSLRTKPVFGGFPELSDRNQDFVNDKGTSAIPRFTFAATPRRVASDLNSLQKLTAAQEIHIIIDAGSYDLVTSQHVDITDMQARIGAKLLFHATRDSADDILEAIPDGAKAAYVTILPRYSDSEVIRLFAELAKRGTFTFSLFGPYGVLAGAAATLASDITESIARRSATSMHQLFLGADTVELEVYLPSEDQLLINANVTKILGWTPDYETYLSAEIVGDPVIGGRHPLDLEKAMDLAANHNADARAVREGIHIANAESRITRSAVLPRIDLSAQHGISRFDSGISSTTNTQLPRHAHAGSYGVELSQILFDDEAFSSLRAQRRLTLAAHDDASSAELDARASGGSAFLRWVLAHRLHEIEKQNLRLSLDNLRLARMRVEIGAAEPAEIFRWESAVARGRATKLRRLTDRDSARSEMNRVLGQAREKDWEPRSIILGDADVYLMNTTLGPIIESEAWSERLRRYFQRLAIQDAPELASFDKALEAQGILLGQKRRTYYSPSIRLRGGYDHTVEGAQQIPTDSRNEWSAGIALSLPLFESGRRRADIDRQSAIIRQLEAQRDSALETIDSNSRTTLDGMAADHANIRLSRRALGAAEKNYRSVEEKYSHGAATILDLLDAQSGLLQERQESEAAVYSYLAGVVRLQRVIAWFESSSLPAERETRAADLKRHMAGN